MQRHWLCRVVWVLVGLLWTSSSLAQSILPIPNARQKAGVDSPELSKFWVTRDPKAETLESVLFPVGHRVDFKMWRALVLHHLLLEAEGAHVGNTSVGCHFVVGAGRELPVGALAVHPKWFAGKRLNHVAEKGELRESVAVCLAGSGQEDWVFGLRQVQTTGILLKVLTRIFGLRASDIYTHREIDGRLTQCPGKSFSKLAMLQAAQLLPPKGRERIVVSKTQRTLTFWFGEVRVLNMGLQGLGIGDLSKTPEGMFNVCIRTSGGAFSRYLGLCAGGKGKKNPESSDASSGVAGGDFAIHGGGDVLHYDWTLGCIALADRDMADLFLITPDGTTVEVKP